MAGVDRSTTAGACLLPVWVGHSNIAMPISAAKAHPAARTNGRGIDRCLFLATFSIGVSTNGGSIKSSESPSRAKRWWSES